MDQLKKQGTLQSGKPTKILDQIRGSANVTQPAVSDVMMGLRQI